MLQIQFMCGKAYIFLCLFFQILLLILPPTWQFLLPDFKAVILKEAALP